jgi:hypothetical protein
LILADSDAKYHKTVIYGPEVQGNKNKLITNHIQNAPQGETTALIIFCIFGLHASGTSILNHFQYQK